MPDDDVTLEEDQKVEGDEQEEELSEEEAEQAKLKEAVTAEAEDIGTLRKKLTVTVPREYIEGRLHEQFAELKREADMPGFRKGRAPLRLIEKRFGRDVDDQLRGPLVGNAFLAALEKHDLKDKTIGEPLVWVKIPEERTEDGKKTTVLADKLLELDQAVEHIRLPAEGPMTFTCEVEMRPEFDLPELKGIPIERPSLEITNDMIDAEIDRIRATRGQYVPVEGGQVEADDLLVADYKCTVGDRVLADEPNRTLAARDQRLEGVAVEGLGQALVGKSVDDAVTVKAAIPDDHQDGDLRGKEACFEFTVRDIKRLKLPEIDEEFLSSLGVDSEEEFRKAIRQDMEFRRQQLVQDQMRMGVRDHLLASTKLEIPAGLSQRQTDRAVARRMIDLYRMGVPQQEVEKRIDALKTTAAEEATEDLKFFFIMERIAEDLEVRVSEEQINNAIAMIAQRTGRRFDRVRDELGRGGGLETLYVRIRDEKIVDQLIEDAEVTEASEKSKAKGKAKKKAKSPKGD